MIYHHISEEWLLKLEEKLHTVTLKKDRLTKRLEKIISVLDEDCQNSVLEHKDDTSNKKELNFIQKWFPKLAIRYRK